MVRAATYTAARTMGIKTDLLERDLAHELIAYDFANLHAFNRSRPLLIY